MIAKCSILSMTGTPKPVQGQPATVDFVIKNTGDSWGAIVVEPDLPWPGWDTTPDWLQLNPGEQGRLSVTIDQWPGGKVNMRAMHWNYDAGQWEVDGIKIYPAGGISPLMVGGLLVGGIAIVGLVKSGQRKR